MSALPSEAVIARPPRQVRKVQNCDIERAGRSKEKVVRGRLFNSSDDRKPRWPSRLVCSSGSTPRNLPLTDNLRSEEHTSELQSRSDLVCRLLLEKKKKQ